MDSYLLTMRWITDLNHYLACLEADKLLCAVKLLGAAKNHHST